MKDILLNAVLTRLHYTLGGEDVLRIRRILQTLLPLLSASKFMPLPLTRL